MGKIIVTGASGQFGGQAAARLLEMCAPQDLILLSRTPDKLAISPSAAADVRQADFGDPASLPVAMADG